MKRSKKMKNLSQRIIEYVNKNEILKMLGKVKKEKYIVFWVWSTFWQLYLL